MKKFFVLVTIVFCFSFLLCAKFEINTELLQNRFSDEISLDKASVDTESRFVTLYFTTEADWIENIDEYKLEMINRFYLNYLIKLKVDFFGIYFVVRKDISQPYRPVTDFLPEIVPVPRKEGERDVELKSIVPEKKYGNIDGSLSGKTVFVSPGHGSTYNTESGYWGYQRSITHGMREDDSNAEIVSYFLVPYLQNAGALVFSARETDRTEQMVIVDDADGSSFPDSGVYEEGGTWTETTSGKGYGRTLYPIEINNNIFENGKYRYAAAGTGSWAKWTPNIPEDGAYRVYVSYKTFTDRAPDAVYTVAHAGGETEVTVNQKHHGSTWVDLGQFYFKKGTEGSVILNKNDDAQDGAILIADAVRFGGGTGILKRGTAISGKPRWEEAAKVHAQFMGAPYSVYQSAVNDRTADVSARSRWAAWENETDADDSVYISWHSNAHTGTSRGLSTYIYSSDDPGWTYVTTEATEGSVELGELVHNRILNSVKTLLDPTFKQIGNGMYSAWFGELNPSHNPEMPACLIELAYHDNYDDAMLLRNPKFRDISARAAYQAIVKYFAERDDYDPVYLPAPPENLMTVVNDDGTVTLFWDDSPVDPGFYLGHPATGYIIQVSEDGLAFDHGTDVGNINQFIFDGLEEGVPLFFRVIAYNDGGVSFPSVTAGAIPQRTGAQILVVDGFERMDHFTPRFNVGTTGSNRYILEYINSYNYIIQYLEVFEQLGFSVDYTQRTNTALIDFSYYDVVIWYSGEQSTTDETFTIAEQGIVDQYLEDGGAFFVSGSEIGWDLVERGSLQDTAFFNEVLNVHYVQDSSEVYTFYGAGDFFEITGSFDDGTYIYQANYPDVIESYDENGENILFYDEEKTVGAGVLTTTGRKVAMLGFPFETILEKDNKISLMEKVFEKFEITPKEIPDPEEPDEDEFPDVAEFFDEDEFSDEYEEIPDEEEFPDKNEVSDEHKEISDEDNVPDKDEEISNDEEVADDLSGEEDDDIEEDSFDEDSSQDGCGCVIIGL
jgi:N-acetylmuramoyl-L-alanine amidase